MWLSTTNTSKMVVERLGTRFRSTGRTCNWNNAFRHCRVESKKEGIGRALKLGVIADNLSKAGWSWGCVSAIDSRGRTIWIADAHRGDGKPRAYMGQMTNGQARSRPCVADRPSFAPMC